MKNFLLNAILDFQEKLCNETHDAVKIIQNEEYSESKTIETQTTGLSIYKPGKERSAQTNESVFLRNADNLTKNLQKNVNEANKLLKLNKKTARELKSDLGRSRTELGRSRSELGRSKSELEKSKSELEKLRSEMKKSKSELLKLKNENETLQKLQLKNNLQENERKTFHMADTKSELVKLKHENETLKNKLAQTFLLLNSAEADLEKSRIKNLQ